MSTVRVEIRCDHFVYRGDRDEKETSFIVSGKGETELEAMNAAIDSLRLLRPLWKYDEETDRGVMAADQSGTDET